MTKIDYVKPADLAVQMVERYSEKPGWNDFYRVDWDNPEKIVGVWVTGGLTGGNCWGDSADHAVEPEAPLDVTKVLAYWMTQNAPDVSFLVYNDIATDSGLISIEDAGSDYEYYGNYTTRAKSVLDVAKLVAKLIEVGIMEEPV